MLGNAFAGRISVSARARGKILIACFLLRPLGLIGLAVIPIPEIALLLSLFIGITIGVANIYITTILQSAVPGKIRRRVFGILSAASMSVAPIAMGLSGIVADLTNQNIPLIFVACAAFLTLVTVLSAISVEFRRFLSHEAD